MFFSRRLPQSSIVSPACCWICCGRASRFSRTLSAASSRFQGPSKAEVDRYIANNPRKFANRKLFSVEQIGFPFGPNGQSLVDANKDAKSLDEIDQQLTAAGIPHGRQMGVLNSADIPQDFYSSIEAKKAEDVFLLRSGPNGIFFKVRVKKRVRLKGKPLPISRAN